MRALRWFPSYLVMSLAACSGAGETTSGAGGSVTQGTSSGSGAAGEGGAAGGHPSGGSGGDSAAPQRTDVTFSTSDGLTLSGYLTTSASGPPGSPGVVLVHQFQVDDEQWGSLPADLAKAGYRALAFDLRGHGQSDPYDGGALSNLLTDPDGAPRDVDAALTYLATEGEADPDRLAVVGTSVGANLAVVTAILGKARTHVAFSARKPPVEALASAPAQGMTSVFYLASENDPGGQAADSQTMYDGTVEPRKITIVGGSGDHGIDLIDKHPGNRDALFVWLADNL